LKFYKINQNFIQIQKSELKLSKLKNFNIFFDQFHNNSITIESPAFNSFINLLFNLNFQIGSISQQISYKKLIELFKIKEEKDFKNNLLILGNPQNLKYSMEEIYSILEFVKNGGNLLIITNEGGDLSNKTNLSEGFGTHFGFKILNNIIFNQKNNAGKVIWPIIIKFVDHPITVDLKSIVYASGCSFELLKNCEFAEFSNVNLIPIILTDETCEMKYYDINLQQWKEEYASNAILAIIGQFFRGCFGIIGTPAIFSNLNIYYGISAKDNFKLIQNLLEWFSIIHENKLNFEEFGNQIEIQLRIEKEIFEWAKNEAKIKCFGDLSYLINYALKKLKKEFEEKINNGKKKEY